MKTITKALLVITLPVLPTMASAALSEPNIPVQNYILLDATTGSIIAEHGADEEKEIASLTKIMTAYVVFKEISNGTLSLTDNANISVKAWKTAGSRMFVEEGSQVSIDKLLSGMLAVSGNDAAMALAEHVSGSEERFVEIMNAYADKIGMANTVFSNVTGLPSSKNPHSTARDLSILVKAIITDFPELYEKFSIKEFSYNGITQKNRNALIHESDNYDGLKTGYTLAAKYCLAASYEKDDRRLITIILGADSPSERFSVAKSLINYGFRRFKNIQPVDSSKPIYEMDVYYGDQDKINVYPAESFEFTIPRSLVYKDEEDDVTLSIKIDNNGEYKPALFAPVEENYQVGTLSVLYKNDVVKEIPLITKDLIKESPWYSKAGDWVSIHYKNLNN